MTIVPPNFPPYTAPYKPVSNITPFTYRDGVTNMELVDGLKRYLNDVIEFVNSNFGDLGDDFETQVNLLLTQIEAALAAQTAAVNDAIEDIAEGGSGLQDAVMKVLIENAASQSRIALDALYAGQTPTNAEIAALVVTGATRTALDTLYANQVTSDSDIAAYVNDDESDTRAAIDALLAALEIDPLDQATLAAMVVTGATRTALDTLYAGQELTQSELAAMVVAGATKTALDAVYSGPPTNAQVAAIVVAGATKTALDTAYAGQVTNAAIAAIVVAGATKTALDSAYAGQLTNAGVAAIVVTGATRTALDTLYAGQGLELATDESLALGDTAVATGDNTIVIGNLSDAGSANRAIVIGYDNEGNVAQAIVIGTDNSTSVGDGIVIGQGNTVAPDTDAAIVIGSGNTIDSSGFGNNSVIIGHDMSIAEDDLFKISQHAIEFGESPIIVRISHNDDGITFGGGFFPYTASLMSSSVGTGYAYVERQDIVRLRVFTDSMGWVTIPLHPHSNSGKYNVGPTTNDKLRVGYMIFDTGLGQPVWLKTLDGGGDASLNEWVLADGTNAYP